MADNKMGAPEIFADDHVQAGFPGTCHAHGQGRKIGLRSLHGLEGHKEGLTPLVTLYDSRSAISSNTLASAGGDVALSLFD